MKKKNKMETSEMEDFEIFYKDIENKVVKERIRSAGEWYIEQAIRCKRSFYILSIIGIILPLVISCVNVLGSDHEYLVRVVTTIASAVVSLTTGILTFTKLREKWTLYRSTIEIMKSELTLYAIGKKSEKDLYDLVYNLEEIMSKEHSKWKKIQQDEDESGKKNNEFSENQKTN